MSQPLGDQNYIYLYDLPKSEINSTKLAQAFDTQCGVTLDGKPQIRRDITRPFYSGIVQIKDAVQFEKASEAMRYFEIDGKMCRALKFDKQLLGSNKEKLLNHNVFVRSIGKDLTHKDLQEKFEKAGKIKSLKVSLNSDHSSRGYGFICFQEEESAAKAVALSENDEQTVAIKFESKERRPLTSIINNLYVKNIPLDWTDQQVKDMFQPYGHIQSLILQKNDIGQFGFVCYGDPESKDMELGPKSAQEAILNLHNRQMENNLNLYVRPAMKRSDRESEKMKETLRYKTSKKRCNLYVKNFPAEWGEENLKTLFEHYGAIEKIRVEKKGKAGNAFAFVCFKTPDAAANAKANLQNTTHDGKILMINHYEIKQLRDLQIEEAIDKSDFEKYQAQKSGGFHLNDLISHPHMTQILQQLLEIMQQNEAMNAHFNHNERNVMRGNNRPQHHKGGFNNHHRGGYQGGQEMRQNNQHMQGGHGGHQGMMNNQMPGAPQPPNRGMPPHQMNQMPQPGAPAPPGAAGMQQMPGMPQMPGMFPPANTANMTPAQRYVQTTQKLLPSVTDKNPYLKDQVGQAIFEFVNMMVAAERAPKITGMLIELPVDQIKGFMGSLQSLEAKVKEATELIDHAEKQGQLQ